MTGRLRPGLGLRALLAAIFPCGSIVGAPKIRAAEVLASLEDAPRGVYTGAIGAFAPGGGAELNVAIRTAVLRPDGSGVYGVGGGVVADSDPDAEYDEARLKGRVLEALAEDFGLIETFRWSAGGFVRLDRHLDRLETSAESLGFLWDRAGCETALRRLGMQLTNTGVHDRRIRLLLRRGGEVEIQDHASPAVDQRLARLVIATVMLDAADPYLRHKTTLRATYDAAAAQADALGADEALLLNRDGEVADAARHTVFADCDGRLLTPPLTAGALPGVLRAEMLGRGQAVESMLTPVALKRATRLFIGNSLRGLRPAMIMA